MYDVAVIGAGPGGSTISRYLAKAGLNICLVDKDAFPRDKPCGGGFSQRILDEFPYLRKRADDFLKGIAKVGVLHSPNRRVILEGKVDMAVTLRTDFDNVLFECAIEQGAEPIVGLRAKSLRTTSDYSEVYLSGGKSIKANLIVGADGVTSMVARNTGLNKRWPNSTVTACRVVEVPATNDEIIERYTEQLHYHFFANLGELPGYAWIFPKRETINVGLGIVGTHARGLPSIFNAFVKYLKKENLLMEDSDLKKAKGALVPTNGPIRRSYANRCLLVGDSAGMVSPLTGGGIAYAMKAARYAVPVIQTCIENSDFTATSLEDYETAWRRAFGNEFKEQLLAQKIFTSPFTEVLFAIGSRDKKIQTMVSESMAESSEQGISITNLVARTLLVCLKSAIRV